MMRKWRSRMSISGSRLMEGNAINVVSLALNPEQVQRIKDLAL